MENMNDIPLCLQALEKINTDPCNWNRLWGVDIDTFKKWWRGIEEMPLHYQWLYTKSLEMILDDLEIKSHGMCRGQYAQCYRLLDLAKKEADNYPKDELEKAAQLIKNKK